MIVDEITISPSFISQLADGQASQGILLTDENLCVTHWNHWMEIHSGLSNQSVTGRRLLDVFPHLSENRVYEEYKKALSGEAVVLEQKLHKYLFPTLSKMGNNGNKFMQQSVRIVPILNGNSVNGTITYIEDVTEQVLREGELERQISELKSFQEVTEALLVNPQEYGFQKVVNESSVLLNLPNVALLKRNESGWSLIAKSSTSGLTHSALSANENSAINKVFSSKENLFCPDVKKYYDDALTTLFHETQTLIAVPVLIEDEVVGVLAAESPVKNAARSHCKNILQRFAGLTASALKNLHSYTQTASHNTVSVNDKQPELTREKSSEEQLQKTLKELADLKSALDAFAIVCITDQHGRITNVNDKFCELTKYSREELLGQDHRILNSGYHSKEFMRGLWTTIARGQIWNGEVKNRAKDGSYHWVDTTIVPFLNEQGKSYQYIVIRYDITKRKEAEEKMKEKKQHLQLALESAELGEWHLDFGSGIMDGSSVFKLILGLNSTTTTVREFLRIVHPEDRGNVKEAFAKALATGKDLHIGYRVIWSDNSIHWIATSGRCLFDEKGKRRRMVGVVRDFTYRKRDEDILKAKEQELQLALQAAKLGMWKRNSKTGEVDASPVVRNLLGLSLDKLIRLEDVVNQTHPEDRKAIAEFRNKAIKEGRDYHLEYRVIKDGGNVHWIATDARCVKDEHGIPDHYVGVSQDITERKNAEEELKRLALVAQKTQNTVLLTNAEDRIVWVNEGFTKMFGYTFEEVLGKIPGELLRGPLTDPKTGEDIKHAFDNHLQSSFEIFNYKKDGQGFWVSLAIAPILADDNTLEGYIGIISDLTERKHFEEELAKVRDAALESAKLKSNFLANISHEIRTPMNGVIGMTELLLDTELDEEQRGYAEIVGSSADSLLKLINDILDFSKIESGKLGIEHIDFNLQDTVKEVFELFSEKAKQKNLAFALVIEQDVPLYLKGDPHRLRQVLTNLIGNALKFTDKGHVLLKVTSKGFPEESGKTQIHFSLSDTGVGISDDFQNQIFNPFTQADGSMTRKYGGTGLGLSICKQLVELMEGEIGNESQLGVGSTFWFTIPLEVSDIKLAKEEANPKQLAGKNALILGIKENHQHLLIEQLKAFGIKCHVAENSTVAEHILPTIGEDCDYNFLIFTSPELITEFDDFIAFLRSNTKLQHLPVLLCSSHTGDVRQTDCMNISNDCRIISLPIQQSDLLKTLNNVCEEANVPNDKDWSFAEQPKLEKKMKVLVVEDTAANQQVARLMLKRLGCDVDVLDNGQSALDATANKDYDIVFMDCQMPVMDGYQATRELRNREGTQKHLTVIAMTAHALSGDKEKCLAAGMDDYIPKPVKQQDLINAIEKWGNRSNVNGNGAAETEAHSEMKLDLASPFAVEIFERMDDLCAALDIEDIVEIIDQFITDSPAQLQKLINAVASKDTQNLVLIAHSLKGSLANLGSAQLSKYCADIEHQARKDSMDGVERNLSELKNSWSKLEKVFLAYKDKISLQSA